MLDTLNHVEVLCLCTGRHNWQQIFYEMLQIQGFLEAAFAVRAGAALRERKGKLHMVIFCMLSNELKHGQ